MFVLFFRKHTNAVLPNILHTVGNTPMVKLNKIPQSMGIKCDMCMFINFSVLLTSH